jgi:elongation factor Ts
MYPHHRFIQSYCHQGRIGVLIEFGLETWLVTQREDFLAISRDLAMHVAASNPDSVDTMLRQPFVRDPTITVNTVLENASGSLGERVTITRIVRWDHEPVPPTATPTPPHNPAAAVRLKRA